MKRPGRCDGPKFLSKRLEKCGKRHLSGHDHGTGTDGKKLENRWRKGINTRKEYRRLLNNFEMEGLMTQKSLWKLAKEKTMKERGELPKEEGDAV